MKKWLPKNRMLRALVILALALVALEALYVVVANIALAASTKRFDDRAPAGASFDRAVTVFPGRIHFHGLRLHGAASDGWSVTTSECDVAFGVWRVITSPRRIDTITADVTDVAFGAKGTTRLSGAMHVVAKDVTLDDALVSFSVNVKVDGVKMDDGGVLATDVHGAIDARVAPVDVASHSMLDAASGTIVLDGVFVSLAPFASVASLTTTQDPGTLHVAAMLDAGHVKPTSEIRAHTAHATLKDEHGANADFPRGLDILLRPVANDLELAVQTPSLVFGSADASRPADTFDDFELALPAASEVKSLTWRSKHVSFHEGASTLGGAADGLLLFEAGHGESLVAIGGDIRATNVTVDNADVSDHTPFDARMVLSRLTLSRNEGIAFRGRLHASGTDATPVFELVVSSPSIRRELTTLPKHAFILDANVERSEHHLTLDDVTLERGALKMRGGYVRRDAQSSGAFLVEGGPLPVGIAMKGKTESIVPAPPASWLEHQLAAHP